VVAALVADITSPCSVALINSAHDHHANAVSLHDPFD
jgi:hypothetical protein